MAWFGKNEQGFAMSIRQIAYSLGGGLGALLLPVVASRLGFNATFAVLAFGCIATTAVAWAWLHDPLEKHHLNAPAEQPESRAAAPSPLRDLKIWRMIAAIGLFSVAQFAVITFASVFLYDVFNAGIGVTATVLVIIQSGAIVARIWSGRWTDKQGNRHFYLIRISLLVTIFFCGLGAFFVLDGSTACQ